MYRLRDSYVGPQKWVALNEDWLRYLSGDPSDGPLASRVVLEHVVSCSFVVDAGGGR